MTRDAYYPMWVCMECGSKFGRRQAGVCTIHQDTCGICGKIAMCTEPRDFGHLKKGWEQHVKYRKEMV